LRAKKDSAPDVRAFCGRAQCQRAMSGLYPYTILFFGERMKPLISTIASFALLFIATLASAAELPFDQARFDADKAAGKPVAVVFHAWWCPTCRAQAPLLKTLAAQPEFAPVTVYIANYDSEKELKKSLRVTTQSTIVVFKDGAERARSTGDTHQDSLAALLRSTLS
jgi:thioredoxin